MKLFSSVLLLALAACATTEATSSTEAAQTATQPGAWGPSYELRDRISVDTDPSSLGTPDGGWFVSPIHVSLLPSGKMFVTGWSRAAKEYCTFPGGSRHSGVSFVLDPTVVKTGADGTELAVTPVDENVSSLPQWKSVLYCAGHVPVVVGDETAVLLTGGSRYLFLGDTEHEIEEGLRSAHLAYGDRATPVIDKIADGMKSGPLCTTSDGQELLTGEAQARGGKWYATDTRLPDGRVLITGGFTGGPRSRCTPDNRHSASAEIFDPSTKTFQALFQPEDLPSGFGERFAPGDKDYTHTILLPEPLEHGGRQYTIAMMGYAGFMVFMSTEPNIPASERFYVPPHGGRPNDAMAWDSSSALLSTGEIMVLGGTNDVGTATMIDLYDYKKDSWTQVDTKVGRRNAGVVLLPDGKALIVNGWRDDSPSLGLDERTKPMIFDPESRALVTLEGAAKDLERGYHGFALLEKDASILVGGGIYPSVATASMPKETDIGCERTDIRRWQPPYLDPSLARPVIAADATIAMTTGGAAVDVAYSGPALDAKKGAVLMALGSFTHGFDQNQRYVRLAATTKNGTATLTPPASSLAAPPGDYLLFLVSDAGAPSTGVHVRLK